MFFPYRGIRGLRDFWQALGTFGIVGDRNDDIAVVRIDYDTAICVEGLPCAGFALNLCVRIIFGETGDKFVADAGVRQYFHEFGLEIRRDQPVV